MVKKKRSGGRFVKRLKKKVSKREKSIDQKIKDLKKQKQMLVKTERRLARFKTNKRSVSNMRRKSKKKSSSRSRQMRVAGMNVAGLVGAAAYGAVRAKVSDALSPVTSKIPAGEISDEVGMLILNGLAAKALPGQFKKIPKAGMTIEAARIGEYLINQGGFLGGSSPQKATSSVVMIG